MNNTNNNNATAKITDTDIYDIAYMLYQRDWINKHVSNERELKSIADYHKYFIENERAGNDTDSYEEWLWNDGNGFDGELYACYEEFEECEYADKEYILSLLGDDEDLKTAYLEAYKRNYDEDEEE